MRENRLSLLAASWLADSHGETLTGSESEALIRHLLQAMTDKKVAVCVCVCVFVCVCANGRCG